MYEWGPDSASVATGSASSSMTARGMYCGTGLVLVFDRVVVLGQRKADVDRKGGHLQRDLVKETYCSGGAGRRMLIDWVIVV